MTVYTFKKHEISGQKTPIINLSSLAYHNELVAKVHLLDNCGSEGSVNLRSLKSFYSLQFSRIFPIKCPLAKKLPTKKHYQCPTPDEIAAIGMWAERVYYR